MTQCEMILKYLEENGSITTFESYSELGITRLPSRINDLQNRGYEFKKDWISKKNRYGKTISFLKYSLMKNEKE